MKIIYNNKEVDITSFVILLLFFIIFKQNKT